MIGGTGWVSTIEYYRLLNTEIQARLGGLNAAKCFLYSFNFGEIDNLIKLNDFDKIYQLVLNAAKSIENAGADCLVLCANTLHRFANQMEKEISIPIVHIATATAVEINKFGIKKVALLGTKQTMELDFYKNKLSGAGIEMIVPDLLDRNYIQHSIFTELLYEKFLDSTKQRFIEIIEKLKNQGAEGIILGCTEIPLLIKQSDVDIKLFDTLNIHVLAVVNFVL